jgi:hypothetical protein
LTSKNILLGLDLAGNYVLVVALMAVQRVLLSNFMVESNYYQLVDLLSVLHSALMFQYHLTPSRQKYLKVSTVNVEYHWCYQTLDNIYIGIFTASYHKTRELE